MSEKSLTREQEFLKRLMATFKVEAQEHIASITSGLLELEKEKVEEKQNQLLETVYREAHSLKGSARAVDLTAVESICQLLEEILKDLKYKGIPSKPEMFDILQQALNIIEMIVTGEGKVDISTILRELEKIKNEVFLSKPSGQTKPDLPAISKKPTEKRRFSRQGVLKKTPKPGTKESDEPGKTESPDVPPEDDTVPTVSDTKTTSKWKFADTIRVHSEKLDNLLLQAEEMIFLKLSLNRRLRELKEMAPIFADLKKKRGAMEPILKTFQEKMIGGEEWEKIRRQLDEQQNQVKSIQTTVQRVIKSLQNDQRVFGSMINNHLEGMRSTLMLPFATLTESLPRMVRDLARQSGKELNLDIKGNDIEIDKRILEQMKAPLIHLVRNAVDHGIESPAERIKLKKSRVGNLQILIRQRENNRVEIKVSDDGAGIELEKVKEKAVSNGIYTTEEVERLNRQELLALVFNSEFTTSSIITDLSGRGLGLAIVRENVENLGGRIHVLSEKRKGTSFTILLQMSLATFRGILVKSADQEFIVPTLNVEQVLKIKPSEIETIENRETIKLQDSILSYVQLDEVLKLNNKYVDTDPDKNLNVVVMTAGDRKIAFQVEDVLNEEEVLVKELGRQLARVNNISGATVLGSGKVVPILNVVDLMKSAVASSAGKRQKTTTGTTQTNETEERKKSILVVEDSITSRMLLKNILESAGYRVQVAVDGMDGWLAVKGERFQLAVLDIEMPGMNGFELTEKIRRDRNLNSMPVVLVTSSESLEDREKGIEVGADAYIVKSSFDQSNLLEIVQRLL
jgi:two-component system, chemotaxis family, sensor kinase CheA